MARPEFAQGICRGADLVSRRADVQLAASPSLLSGVPLARHVTDLDVGDRVVVMLPDAAEPVPGALVLAVLE